MGDAELKELTALLAMLLDNAALQEKIASSEKRCENLEQNLTTAHQNTELLRKQSTNTTIQAFDPSNARVFQETECDCPMSNQAACFHCPQNMIHSLPQINPPLTADSPPGNCLSCPSVQSSSPPIILLYAGG